MPATPPSTPSGDLPRIRQALTRALEAVTAHEASAAQAESQEVRDFFTHLAAEQKEHAAEAIAMLQKLDPAFGALLGAGFTPEYFAKPVEVKAPLPSEKHFERLVQNPARLVQGLPAPPSPMAGQLTVGSLRNR